jgi:hypothetical protein
MRHHEEERKRTQHVMDFPKISEAAEPNIESGQADAYERRNQQRR